ncbi:MAG: ABC transporter substrate-binding protein [Rubrivivax sp.]|nr:ABC transporter substrate-binding protein [Rubrivivax sp.]
MIAITERTGIETLCRQSARAAIATCGAAWRLARAAVALVIGAAALGWAATPAPALAQGQPVRVASKIDTEGALLGQLIVQLLQAHGIATQNRLSLGNTKIVRTALIAGEVDLYPEYTGNGAFFHADDKNAAWKDRQQGYARIKALDQDKHRLVWLAPAPANNTWAIAVRKDLAAAHQLHTLADLARFVGGGGRLKLAASAEFAERADALPAFQSAYGFKLAREQLLLLAGGDTAATLRAAAEQTSGVNAAMAYGTDGPVAALGLLVLEDPKGVQPVYAPAPVVRAEVLAREPRIATVLAPLFKLLDAPTLQRLNAQIALEGRDARQVARAFLEAQGLVK